MMKRLWLLIVPAVLLGMGVDKASGGPISSTLSLRADSNAGTGTVSDVDSQSQGATVNPLTASVLALAVNGSASVETTANGSATWTNPNVGQVILSNVGWITRNVTSGFATLTQGLDFSYTFTADASGVFSLSYAVVGGGSNTFGLNGFNYNFSGHGVFFNLGTSGTVTESVVAGNTYTLNLRNQANISGGLGTRDAHMTGQFNFTSPEAISAVPAPAGVILLGFGALSMMGYAWRRRRKDATLAC